MLAPKPWACKTAVRSLKPHGKTCVAWRELHVGDCADRLADATGEHVCRQVAGPSTAPPCAVAVVDRRHPLRPRRGVAGRCPGIDFDEPVAVVASPYPRVDLGPVGAYRASVRQRLDGERDSHGV